MTSATATQIIEHATDMGAAMAGIASVELLKSSPSHQALKEFGMIIDGVGSSLGINDFDGVKWPSKARSVLVIALSHPRTKPELDWSDASGNTPGNRRLTSINREVSAWIEETLDIRTQPLPY